MRLLRRVLLALLPAVRTEMLYAIHTSDNRLSFVRSAGDIIETLELGDGTPRSPAYSPIEYHPPAQRPAEQPAAPTILPRLRSHHGRDHAPSSPRLLPAPTGRERIAAARLLPDGHVLFAGHRIPLASLLSGPFYADGVCIAATKLHAARLVCETLVLTATVRVAIHDLHNSVSRTISFRYLVYLFEARDGVAAEEGRAALERAAALLNTPVAALYACPIEGAARVMVRLHPKREQEPFLVGLETVRPRERVWAVVFSVVAVLVAAYAVGRRGVTYGRRLGEGMYEGRFAGRACLLYSVSREWVARHEQQRRMRRLPFVECPFVGWRFGWRVAVTELTYQLCLGGAVRGCGGGSGGNEVEREVLASLCEAVERLHAAGVVHGRLCPENVRVSVRGEVRLQDTLPARGWQSPRQILSAGRAAAEPRDDIFALGCVAHYLSTGRHPFDYDPSWRSQRLQAVVRAERVGRGNGAVVTDFRCEGVNGCVGAGEVAVGSSEGQETQCDGGVEAAGQVEAAPLYCQALAPIEIHRIEVNVVHRSFTLRIADQVHHDLIYSALFKDALRLSKHPFFWTAERRTEFLCDFSDFIENQPRVKSHFERRASAVFAGNWTDYIDPQALVDLQARRSYDATRLAALVRLIRNTYRHRQELASAAFFAQQDGGVGGYYMRIFPELFMATYSMNCLRDVALFARYFD